MKTHKLRTLKHERSLIKVKKETSQILEGFNLFICLENEILRIGLQT
jgi:hypothetical protein